MVVNGKLFSAYIATMSGINPRVIVKDNGQVVFSFPSEGKYFELRSEAENMTNEELLEAIDPVVNEYLRDLIYVNKRKLG